MSLRRPARAELLAAAGGTVGDVIGPGLAVLFCGINPSLYSAAVGHHFARPGNRFWPTLFGAGFTDRLLSPAEDRELLRFGCGVTNVVERATARADELSRDELRAGRGRLVARVERFAPRVLAVLGIGAYRTGFERPDATLGLQPERIGGTSLWLLPNPSGLNANHQLPQLIELFRELRGVAFRAPRP